MIFPDTIPDAFLYILLAPFIPIAGFIHISLGVLQIAAILIATTVRIIFVRTHPEGRVKLIQTVYLPCILLPNIGVVIWDILTAY